MFECFCFLLFGFNLKTWNNFKEWKTLCAHVCTCTESPQMHPFQISGTRNFCEQLFCCPQSIYRSADNFFPQSTTWGMHCLKPWDIGYNVISIKSDLQRFIEECIQVSLYKCDYFKITFPLKMIIKVYFCSFLDAEHIFLLGEMR